MSQAAGQRQARGRGATRLVLRLWAALLALLLCGSSLGETAHFLLVQHAVCAEHGELIEVHEGSQAAAPGHDAAPPQGTQASAPDPDGEHDHCQMLGRRQQELTLPQVAAVALAPQAPATVQAALHESPTALASLSALSLAPKTSPPTPAAIG